MGKKTFATSFLSFLALLFLLLLADTRPVSGVCAIPTGLSTTFVGNSNATLNWYSTVSDSFLVRYYITGTTNYLYKFVRPGTAVNTVITGLFPNTSYSWQVHTYCSGGAPGAYQPSITFTTTNTPVSCVTPYDALTSNITANTALVSWSPMVMADSFMIRYAPHGTTAYVWIKVPGAQHAVTLSGLLPNTSYDWWVRCICGASPQAYCKTNVITTLSSSCGIADVNYFSNTGTTSSSSTVGWRAVTGALSYNVRYCVRNSGNWIVVPSSTISKTVTGLLASTWYEFQVQTVCSSGSGAWSASGIFLTIPGTLSISRGPYVQLSTPTSIYIRWRTNNPSDTKVKYGTTLANQNLSVTNTLQQTEHIVQISGLIANTKYYYSVGTAALTIQGDSSNYFFTNPVAGSTNPIRIWVIGDFGVSSAAQAQVRDAYVNYTGSTYTNVWLTVGDNAYASGTDAEFQANVFNQYTNLYKKWVQWPATGNHDLASCNPVTQTGPYFDNFSLPKSGEAGGLASGTEAYYSFNYANVHFICLESNDAVFRATNGAMVTWLTSDLTANTQRWTVVYFHHPPYSKGSHNSDYDVQAVEMRTNILPILESKKVDLVLTGHSHSYERSMLIQGHYGIESTFNAATMAVNSGTGIFPAPYVKASPSYSGTIYAVLGVSGQLAASTAGWPYDAMVASSVSTYGSVVIDVNGDRLDYKFLTSTGTIWDQFTIQKQGSPMRTVSNTKRISTDTSPIPLEVIPNPVTDIATIEYSIEKDSRVKIDVLDLAGRIVYSSNEEMAQQSGRNQFSFPVRDAALPKGIYFIRLIAGDQLQSKKFIIE